MRITTAAERPHLLPRLYDFADSWPVFMEQDPVANALCWRAAGDFPEHCVIATDGERVIARGLAVPFNAELDGREETPDQGWDRVLVWAYSDRHHRRPTTVASALEITIDVAYTGRGLSHLMLAAMRDAAARQGHGSLLAPVRPNAKHLRPRLPMADYIRETREDGLPTDPWLRVHVRAGGTVEKVAPASMTIAGSLAQWRGWTGLPFDRDGEVEVPGALSPVHCDTAHDRAVYVEPNVWVRHRTGAGNG
ncbi:N-acetyltransferase [Streptomyces capparidis]